MKLTVCALLCVMIGMTLCQSESDSSSHETDGTDMCRRDEGCLCDTKITPVAIMCEGMGLHLIYEQTDWQATFESLHLVDNITLDVSFNDNALEEIPRFPPLPIEILTLRYNQIKFIENKAFAELKQLRVLDLSHNNLNELVLFEGVFTGQYNASDGFFPLPIEHLNLSHNGIHSLDRKAFDHLTHLTTLDVSHNPLKTLAGSSSMAIASLRRLVALNVGYTQVSAMHEGMLQDLKFLTGIVLEGNEFVKVPQELRHTHQLAVLNLDRNKIETLDDTSFIGLDWLEDLSLRNNEKLMTVEEGTFGGLKKLAKLDLSFCKRLETLNGNAFMGLFDKDNVTAWPLKDIRLNDNGISQVDEGFLPWDEIDYIDIQNNPFRCDCNLEWMLSVLMPKIKKASPALAVGINCAQPKAMRGKALTELMEDPELFSKCKDSKDELFPEEISLMQSSSYRAAGITLMVIGVLMCVMAASAIVFAVIKRRAIAKALVAHQEIRYERADSDDDGIGSMNSVPGKNNRRNDVF